MSGKLLVALGLLAALLLCSGAAAAASLPTPPDKMAGPLRQLPANGERAWARGREQRRAHLSEDEREIMTKQIMQAISEVMNSECMLDRDYQGWVDFGRRDAE